MMKDLRSLESMDIEFLSSSEIIKMLALRAKRLRKRSGKNQKDFSIYIGVSYGTYIKFEKSGEISLSSFIDVVRGLSRLEDISNLLKFSEISEVGLKNL